MVLLFGKSTFLERKQGLIWIFSISPKCYFATCLDNKNIKRSSKGIQHRVLLTYEDYKNSVYESESKEVQNISIRLHENKMKTVVSTKRGLKNALFKAFVHDDRITVSPFVKFT